MDSKIISLVFLGYIIPTNYAFAQSKADTDGKFVEKTATMPVLEPIYPSISFYNPEGFKMFLTVNYSDISGPTIEPREVLIRVEELRNSDLLEKHIYSKDVKLSADDKTKLEHTLYQFVGGKKTSEEFAKNSSAAWKDSGYEDVSKLGQAGQEQLGRYALYGFFFGEKPFEGYAKDEASLWKEKGYTELADNLARGKTISSAELIQNVGKISPEIGRKFARPDSMKPNSSFDRNQVRAGESMQIIDRAYFEKNMTTRFRKLHRTNSPKDTNAIVAAAVGAGMSIEGLEKALERPLTDTERKEFNNQKAEDESRKSKMHDSIKESIGGTNAVTAPVTSGSNNADAKKPAKDEIDDGIK
ncbi:MAG: hypothetical protein JWQ35_155 [Bacteriovoracaceae bacterium]|nr:hypothetical protein [Bacteriovoracaceae bacterium]